MDVALLGAITSTMMTALPFVPIMLWRREKFVTGTVQPPVMTPSFAPPILLAEASMTVLHFAFSPTSPLVKMETGAVHLDATIMTTVIAVPPAAIAS